MGKYLPWCTRLYIAISRFYHQAGKLKAAHKSITCAKNGGLTKAKRLKSLEEIDENVPIQKAYTINMCIDALSTQKFKFECLLNPPGDEASLKSKLSAVCKTQ